MNPTTAPKFRSRFQKGDVFHLITRYGTRPIYFHRYGNSNGFVCFDSFGTLYKCHTIGHWGEFRTQFGQTVSLSNTYHEVNRLRCMILPKIYACRSLPKLQSILEILNLGETTP